MIARWIVWLSSLSSQNICKYISSINSSLSNNKYYNIATMVVLWVVWLSSLSSLNICIYISSINSSFSNYYNNLLWYFNIVTLIARWIVWLSSLSSQSFPDSDRFIEKGTNLSRGLTTKIPRKEKRKKWKMTNIQNAHPRGGTGGATGGREVHGLASRSG